MNYCKYYHMEVFTRKEFECEFFVKTFSLNFRSWEGFHMVGITVSKWTFISSQTTAIRMWYSLQALLKTGRVVMVFRVTSVQHINTFERQKTVVLFTIRVAHLSSAVCRFVAACNILLISTVRKLWCLIHAIMDNGIIIVCKSAIVLFICLVQYF